MPDLKTAALFVFVANQMKGRMVSALPPGNGYGLSILLFVALAMTNIGLRDMELEVALRNKLFLQKVGLIKKSNGK